MIKKIKGYQIKIKNCLANNYFLILPVKLHPYRMKKINKNN